MVTANRLNIQSKTKIYIQIFSSIITLNFFFYDSLFRHASSFIYMGRMISPKECAFGRPGRHFFSSNRHLWISSTDQVR